MQETSELLQSLLEFFSMFKISIWYDNEDIIEGLGIEYINCNKVVSYEL